MGCGQTTDIDNLTCNFHVLCVLNFHLSYTLNEIQKWEGSRLAFFLLCKTILILLAYCCVKETSKAVSGQHFNFFSFVMKAFIIKVQYSMAVKKYIDGNYFYGSHNALLVSIT